MGHRFPPGREARQQIDLDELVREVAAGAEQDDGLRRLLRASLRMCGQGAQSRLCLPGFALEAVRGAMRNAVERRPGGRPGVVDVAGRLLHRVVCQGDAVGCCLTPGIYCATMTQGPLLRLLGEDGSAPDVGMPMAGPGPCDVCREPQCGTGPARACARARRYTELRGAELRLGPAAESLETGLESVPRAGLRLAVARLLGLRRRLRLRVVCAWLDLSLGRLEPVLGL